MIFDEHNDFEQMHFSEVAILTTIMNFNPLLMTKWNVFNFLRISIVISLPNITQPVNLEDFVSFPRILIQAQACSEKKQE